MDPMPIHIYILYHAQGIAKKRKAIPYISPIGPLLPTTHYFKHSAAEKLVSGTELGESKGGHLKPARDSPNFFVFYIGAFKPNFLVSSWYTSVGLPYINCKMRDTDTQAEMALFTLVFFLGFFY